jgi:hypothetical protein
MESVSREVRIFSTKIVYLKVHLILVLVAIETHNSKERISPPEIIFSASQIL